MFAFIEGKLHSKKAGEAVINCSGVGYLLNISMQTYDLLPQIGETILLHTYFVVREDTQQLFGFLTESELELFTLLISISGVGPKSALGILSAINPNDLYNAILHNDLIKLQKLPGIGKKTSELLVLHLRDKVIKLDLAKDDSSPNAPMSNNNHLNDEAVSALISLGYSKGAAEKAVKQSEQEFAALTNQNIEGLIRLALKFAMK